MRDQGRNPTCSSPRRQRCRPRRLAAVPVRAAVPLLVAAWLSGCAEPAAPPAKPPIQTRKTIRQTTQNVLELSAAVAAGGVPAEMSVTSDGLDAVADAYRTSVGKIGAMAVEQRMRLYEAEHGSKPTTYEEFMAKIIAPGTPDPLGLPMLPYYQEWAYDPEAQGVVVIEFPAKKEQRQRETTGAAGL